LPGGWFAVEMALIDLILNLVALALWWNWLALRFDPLAKTSAASLIGTLRKADPVRPKRWRSLAALFALLFFRAIFYWEFGQNFGWTPALHLELINLPFRSDYFSLMLLFSFLSFALALGVFYLWMLLLSVANAHLPDTDPTQRLVRGHFRWLEHWPAAFKVLLPFIVGALVWTVLHPLFVHISILPKTANAAQLFQQAALMGAATYLAAKYLIIGILVLHLLNSYVYFGNHPFWNFVNATATNFLRPLRWLPMRFGKVDFLPLFAIAVIFFATEAATYQPDKPGATLRWVYQSLYAGPQKIGRAGK